MVRNPKSGRMIAVGGRIWKKLVSDNLLNVSEVGNETIFKGNNASEVKKSLKVPLPDGKKLICKDGTIRTKNNKYRNGK